MEGLLKLLIEFFKVVRLFFFFFFFPFSFFLFWPQQAACRILVPQPMIEPVPPAIEAQSPNHWTAREVPVRLFIFLFLLESYWVC